MAKLCKQKSAEFKANQYSPRFKELKRLVAIEKKKAVRMKIEAAVEDSGGTMSWLSMYTPTLEPSPPYPPAHLCGQHVRHHVVVNTIRTGTAAGKT